MEFWGLTKDKYVQSVKSTIVIHGYFKNKLLYKRVNLKTCFET